MNLLMYHSCTFADLKLFQWTSQKVSLSLEFSLNIDFVRAPPLLPLLPKLHASPLQGIQTEITIGSLSQFLKSEITAPSS